uniref:Mon2_C domain-containing protein n=2 Tax=Mesocestoides corti TaxID=53468 RepID=A0A5K3F171_MESCO
NSLDSCFPPGFLLLRALRWHKCSLLVDSDTGLRQSILDAFVCRLREALQYWLKKDSQDDFSDPYGLRSSSAVSFLRMGISLVSELEQTAIHQALDLLNAVSLVDRIKQFDISSSVKCVGLDSIASSIYAEIDRWHCLRFTPKSVNAGSASLDEQPEEMCGSSPTGHISRRLDPPSVLPYRLDEFDIPESLQLASSKWQEFVQQCTSKIKQVALRGSQRDRRLEHLHDILHGHILPRLYQIVSCHRSDVVECQPLIQIPLLLPRVCRGGARITLDFQSARLEPAVEAERIANHRDAAAIIGEAWDAAVAVATASCRQTSTTLPPSVPLKTDDPSVDCPTRVGTQWIVAAFRLISLLQRIVESRQVGTRHSPDANKHFADVFNFLRRCLSGAVWEFGPSKVILSQCLNMLAEDLVSSDDIPFDVLLDTLVVSPPLPQSLFSRIWPLVLQASPRVKSLGPADSVLAVYRRLPSIIDQLGVKPAYDLVKLCAPTSSSSSQGDVEFASTGPARSHLAGVVGNMVIEAFQCFIKVKRKTHINDEDAVLNDLIELLRRHLADYLTVKYPETLLHLLKTSSTSKESTAQAELWSLVKRAISSDIAAHNECSLSLDDANDLLQKVNQSASAVAGVGPRGDFSDATADVVECLGLLNQQVALKLNRCVELGHMSLQSGQKFLAENIFSSLWPWILVPQRPPSDEPSPPTRQGVKQLADVFISLYTSKVSTESPKLLSVLLDSAVNRIFSEPPSRADVDLLDQVTCACQLQHEAAGLPEGFPWTAWRPSMSTLSTLTQFVNMLQRPTTAMSENSKQGNSVAVPILVSMSRVLSRVCWTDALVDVQVSANTDHLVSLVVAVICAYDAITPKQEISLCSEDLRQFMEGVRGCLLKHNAFVRLPPADLERIRSCLRPASIVETSDLVYDDFFSLLAIASHMSPHHSEPRSNTDLYPQISPHCISTSDVLAQRRAFVSLCVDFLVASSPGPCEIPSKVPPTDTHTLTTGTTAARAYSILTTSILPAATSAIGAVVSTVSSSPLWQRVFGETHNDGCVVQAFEKLTSSEAPSRGFAWRVCRVLRVMEKCYAPLCWDPLHSDDYEEVVSQCEQLLKLRAVNESTRLESQSGVADVVLDYWMSVKPTTSDAGVSPSSLVAFPQAHTTALHRPLLQALLYELPEASAAQTPLPLAAVMNLVDKCLWCLLQTNPSKCSPVEVPTDFDARMESIGELLVQTTAGAQKRTRLHDSVSWLVPACLTCRKLLPLFVHAYARRACMGSVDVDSSECLASPHQRKRSPLTSSESPAILLADIMHWLALLELRPSDVCAKSCTESPQLTGLLLLYRLAIEQIVVYGGAPHAIPQIPRLISCLQGIATKWSAMTPASSASSTEMSFLVKYSHMTECVVAVLEAWNKSPSDSTTADAAPPPPPYGLARLRRMGESTDDSSTAATASIARALLARLGDDGSERAALSADDVLASFAFLCQRFWSPLHDFMDILLWSQH